MSELNQLSRQVRDVGKLVVQVQKKLGEVSQDVDAVATETKTTHSELDQLRKDFLKYVLQAELADNRQAADARKIQLMAQLDSDFGHYKTVRLTATGLLQAFDVGIVSRDTVRTVTEELMIQTPRYWLAPALVALAAWSADDRSLCDRAIEEAFRRSPSRTAMFFSLILRRQGRQPSAGRWLRQYLEAADPMALGRDFAVILEAVAQGAFGSGGREQVQAKLALWMEKLGADDAVIAAQVERWKAEVRAHTGASVVRDFPKLALVSPQWAQLDAGLQAAAAHQALLTHYSVMLDEESAVTAGIEEAVDDILDRLVSEYDVEELPLRRDLDRQEAILDCRGDLDAARTKVDAEASDREDTLDYLTIQTTSALRPDRIGVSRATQRVAVSACEPWFRQAHAEFGHEYRGQLPTDVQARFDSSHNFGASAFQLPTWKGSFTRPMPELEDDLRRHWNKTIDPFLSSLRYNWEKAAVLPGIGIALVVFFCLIGQSYAAAALIALVGSAVLGFVLWQRFEAMEKLRRQAEKTLTAAKNDSLAQLREAGAELTDWTSRFRTADAQEGQVVQLLDALKLAGHAATPFDQRSFTYVQGGRR
jgi:hypothetical protein